MHHIASLFVTCRVRQGGQTMTEYALILAAVALVACAAYQLMGTTITTTLSSVDNLWPAPLTPSSSEVESVD